MRLIRAIGYKTSVIVAMHICICSCNDGPAIQNGSAQQAVSQPKAKAPIIKKPVSSFQDTLTIQTLSAVFYNPDSLQLEKIKAVNEPQIYATITHDCFYQMQNARIMIKKDWPKIDIIDNSNARYLLFIKADHSRVCIDLDGKNDICGIFLFDRKNNPALIDMPNVSTALNLYFKP